MSTQLDPAEAPAVRDTTTVDVDIASVVSSVPSIDDIESWVTDAVNEIDTDLVCNVSIRVVDETEGRTLNQQYRGRDDATNVLSFPIDDGLIQMSTELSRALGDIVICGPIVEREAARQGKNAADHWAHLLVHGTLHLLGYDHEQDHEALQMEAIEKRILARHGLGDPYEA